MCVCVCVCVAYAVSKPSVDISPICIILIKAGGYHLTLPAAHCCTVKNTARVFWEGSRCLLCGAVH